MDPRSVVEGASPPPSPLFVELTALFRREPGAVGHVLAQHVDDGTGHCRVCTSGGQTGHYRHPCAILLAAVEAKTRRRNDEVGQG